MKLLSPVLTCVAFGCAIASAPASAAGGASFVDGVWTGKGTFQMGGEVHTCPDIRMTFKGSATTYEVDEASMICDGLGKQTFSEIDKFTIDADGGITFVQGTATSLKPNTLVGSVKGNTLTTLNPIDEAKIDDIRMRLDGDVLIYDQIASAPGKTPDYALVAIMRREKPTVGEAGAK